MINSTPEYRAAIYGLTRRIYLRAVVNIVDPDLVYGTPSFSAAASFSKPEQVHDKEFELTPLATLEKDRWVLDGSFNILPKDKNVFQLAYASEEASLSDGSYKNVQFFEQPLNNTRILQAFSVYFPTAAYDGVPADFEVQIKEGGNVRFRKSFTGNSDHHVSLSGFTVNNPDAIRVEITKWSMPYRKARIVEIVPGVYERWDSSMLAEFNVVQQSDFSCMSLPYGSCTLKMDNADRKFEPRFKEGIFASIEDRQGIEVMIGVRLPDMSVDYKQVGIFYQYSGGWKTSNNDLAMQWYLVDILGLLANKRYIVPESLPTDLKGWIGSAVSQLGVNFAGHYHIDPSYENKPVTALKREDVQDRTCGDIIMYACMSTGTFPRARSQDGYVCIEPYWNQGNKLTLDEMPVYPTIRANEDISALFFKVYDGGETEYTVSGASTSSSKTLNVDNPFIHSKEEALVAARQILSTYGGSLYEITSRGDPSSEIGDVDTFWLDESSATTGRRKYQSFNISDGVLQSCKSTLLQANGSYQFENRVLITAPGPWKAPAGVTKLRLILVEKGGDGLAGTDGTWESAGEDGADGLGGLVWSDTVPINEQQEFVASFGEHTLFGPYSSADGNYFENGYTDIASGDVYARTGVKRPLDGTGDGGAGGSGGVKGNKHIETITVPSKPKRVLRESGGDGEGQNPGGNPGGGGSETVEVEVIDNYPGPGQPGVKGASGCIVIWFDKPEAST